MLPSTLLGLVEQRYFEEQEANNKMRITNVVLVCLLIAIGCGSCRMIDTLTGNSKAGTANNVNPE